MWPCELWQELVESGWPSVVVENRPGGGRRGSAGGPGNRRQTATPFYRPTRRHSRSTLPSCWDRRRSRFYAISGRGRVSQRADCAG